MSLWITSHFDPEPMVIVTIPPVTVTIPTPVTVTTTYGHHDQGTLIDLLTTTLKKLVGPPHGARTKNEERSS